MKIIDVKCREILDSRGFPTVETDVVLEGNIIGRASIPSGASTGSNEALELRDNEDRYMGKGVKNAVSNVLNIIKPNIINMDINSQEQLDNILIKLDGTENKTNLGANAILSVSLAFLKACAKYENKELYEYVGVDYKIPRCMFNIVNGGMHANNGIDIQEFMITVNRNSIAEQLEIAANVFHTLKNIFKKMELSTAVGDEGGFAPSIAGNLKVIEIICFAIKEAGYKLKDDVSICLDVAASSFYDKDRNLYFFENTQFTKEQLLKYYKDLVQRFPIISIEDPFYEEDFESFRKLSEETNIMVVGDDLFTTNKKRLQKGIDNISCNAILLKANQIGTMTEMFNTIKLARDNNYYTIISHRSGETEDTFISDLAVGLNLGWMKSGSLSRGERICKYNRLIRIEEKL